MKLTEKEINTISKALVIAMKDTSELKETAEILTKLALEITKIKEEQEKVREKYSIK